MTRMFFLNILFSIVKSIDSNLNEFNNLNEFCTYAKFNNTKTLKNNPLFKTVFCTYAKFNSTKTSNT